MRDDDLEELALLLGSPSEAQMWKQHSRLVEAELCIVQTELSKARRDLKQLADLYQGVADELARLKVAHEALGREKNRVYVEYVALSNRVNFSATGHAQ
ncbi:hypothetical protein C1896_07800 [Pseudomonadaceae bacterium SI-3]|jgi:uncharacterized protein (DUF3084 family)|nr:hypothetical protein C1896_07800 [Pseudomonadaceae bacterium SI-3]